MRRFLPLLLSAFIVGCSDCSDTLEDERPHVDFDVSSPRVDAGSVVDTGTIRDSGAPGDALDDRGASDAADVTIDHGGSADAATSDARQDDGEDLGTDASSPDGDVNDDTGQIGPVCGDGILDPGETCDDGVTADCATTHDGGDGSCAPAGTCAPGYSLHNQTCVANATGLSVPCQNGPGWTLFRFHYSNNSTSAQIDVWDASCSYSFAPNSACNVREVYPGFGEVSRTSQGYPIFTSTHYLRVRFDVSGLSFTSATLWIQARSYATGASTFYDAESILYGVREGGPVDNDFVYDWYALDWTGFLSPFDDPNLTAIQLYAGRGSGSLAVSAVELCVE